MAFRIFISHDVDSDGRIADVLQRELRTLSEGEVECQICSQQPGGTEWRRWIEREVSRSDLFVYVYTTDRRRQDWLLFEAGVFLGARRAMNGSNADTVSATGDPDTPLTQASDTDLVCIKSAGVLTPPAPIEHLQSYEADPANLRRFFEDLLVEGAFSGGRAINRKLHAHHDRRSGDEPTELSRATINLQKAFERSSIKSRFYMPHMVIGPIDPNLFDGEANPAFSADTPVEVSAAAGKLIDLPRLAENMKHTWEHVDALERPDGDWWPEDLRQVAARVVAGRSIDPILTPFRTKDGNRCYPVVSRADTIEGRVHKFSVIFVEDCEDADQDEAPAAARAPVPARFRAVTSLIELTRRTRWDVIDRFDDRMRMPARKRPGAAELVSEFDEGLSRLEEEAYEAGWLDPAAVKGAFPALLHTEIEELFGRYQGWRKDLQALIEEPDARRLGDLSGQLEEVNKRFWLMALDRYEQLVDELSPSDVRSPWAAAREAGEAQAWDRFIDDWRGIGRDIEIPGLLAYNPRRAFRFSCSIARRGRDVGGEFEIFSRPADAADELPAVRALARGLFAVDRFVAFEYRMPEEQRNPRFGLMLLKISSDWRVAHGLYIAKKAFEDDKIGFGQVAWARADAGIEPAFDSEPMWVEHGAAGAGDLASG